MIFLGLSTLKSLIKGTLSVISCVLEFLIRRLDSVPWHTWYEKREVVYLRMQSWSSLQDRWGWWDNTTSTIESLSTNSINLLLYSQVAPYKRIRRVAFTTSIPKNQSGKILRKDLIQLATSKLWIVWSQWQFHFSG